MGMGYLLRGSKTPADENMAGTEPWEREGRAAAIYWVLV